MGHNFLKIQRSADDGLELPVEGDLAPSQQWVHPCCGDGDHDAHDQQIAKEKLAGELEKIRPCESS